jgi:hypothetical protein
MTVAIYTKDEAIYGISRQATWGTAITTGFILMDVEPTAFDPDTKVRKPNRAGSGQRTVNTLNIIQDTKGSAPKITLSGLLKKDDAAILLYGVMQGVSEAGTTPFTKTFTFPSVAGSLQPDFTASAGCFFTVNKWMPDQTLSQRMVDAIITELTITWSGIGDDAVAKFKATFMGRTWANNVNLSAITPTRATQADDDLFYFIDLKTFTGNALALDPLSFEITFKNNAKAVGVDKTVVGKFLTYALGDYECNAKAKVIWDTNARTLQAASQASTSHAWVASWGTGGSDGNLAFALQAVPGPAPDEDSETNTVDFTLTGVQSGATKPITVTLSDAKDWAF